MRAATFEFHDYVASQIAPIQHTTGGEDQSAEGGEAVRAETITPFSHMPLPSVHIDGAWESLIFDAEIKTELLQ